MAYHPGPMGPGSRKRLARAVVVLLALGGAVPALASGCNLIVDTKADQCSVDADCAALGGGACVAGVCTTGAAARECTKNADCASRGAFTICNHAKGTCAALKSKECTTVEGDYADDDALIIGSVLPTAGDDKDTGRAMENSIRLALWDFRDSSGGVPLPSGTKKRPFVLVGCNDNSDSDTAVVAADHLANTVGVPAIVGASFSGITIQVATKVTIPAGVLLISPSATSVAITDLADEGLVWRTAPSDTFQAQAIAKLMPSLEQSVRDELTLGVDAPVRVAILNKGDSYGSGLGKALEKILTVNGKPALDPTNQDAFKRFDYGNPDDAKTNPPSYTDKVAAVIAFKPHVVMIFGTNEGVTDVFAPLVAKWGGGTRPRFLFSDGGLVNDLWVKIGADADLRKRVLGTIPGTNNQLFLSFKQTFKTKFSDGTDPAVFGAAGAYDASYLLAYASFASGEPRATGAGLAKGLKRLVPPGATTPVGTDAINAAFKALSGGNNIDFDGASGPLSFDVATGDAPSDIQIWCLPKDGSDKATSAQNSGQYFDAATGKLAGEIDPTICGQ
jgi:branched-chain amino acid transport system substrate-binding protein